MCTKMHTSRVVVLVDMDCFYCQVEENLDPKLTGKPIAVVQYNAWKGGGIIAVNYPARNRGVTRHMRGDEAKKKCPEIELVKVPNVRGKADLSKYREAGKRVAEVLQTFTPLLQRASVDEAYLDITEEVKNRLESQVLTKNDLPNTHVVGVEIEDFIYNLYNSELKDETNLKLAIGGAIVEEIRDAVYKKTGFRCSAGIAHNKILAKLACGLHKPNQQTILPQEGVEELYKNLPLKKIKNLGGKFGNTLSEDLNITYMGELIKFSERDLQKKYDEKTASWLYNIARGIDKEPVEVRLISKSIGCCKKFPGKTALTKVENVLHWISELAEEIAERLEQDLEENNRRAKQITVGFGQLINRKNVQSSRVHPLSSYDSKKIANDALEILKKHAQKSDGSFHITFLGLNVGKFEDCNKTDIATFFKLATSNKQYSDKNEETLDIDEIEEDSENYTNINLNETLKDLENIKTITDVYLDETIEGDFSEQLQNKQEFPNVLKEDTSKSFFMKFVKNFNNNQTSTSTNQQVPNKESQAITEENAINEIQVVCPECNKEVQNNDFISHLDHHMAEKLMAEEKQLLQQEIQAKKQNLLKPLKTKSVKRKTPVDNCSITSFLSVKQTNKENGEMQKCPECEKQVSVENFACHLDFHAAKKLHLELNPVKFGGKIENVSKKKNNCTNGMTSISNYFKTV